MACIDYHSKGICQVKLALNVVGFYLLSIFEQNLIVEKVITGINLLNFELFGCAVGVLDDAFDIAVSIANDSSIAGLREQPSLK